MSPYRTVAVPAGPLSVVFFGNRVTEVRSSSPLAGQVAHGDRLVSINTPGRAMFRCRTNVSGLDIVHEIRAGAASDGRVLTFATLEQYIQISRRHPAAPTQVG